MWRRVCLPPPPHSKKETGVVLKIVLMHQDSKESAFDRYENVSLGFLSVVRAAMIGNSWSLCRLISFLMEKLGCGFSVRWTLRCGSWRRRRRRFLPWMWTPTAWGAWWTSSWRRMTRKSHLVVDLILTFVRSLRSSVPFKIPRSRHKMYCEKVLN